MSMLHLVRKAHPMKSESVVQKVAIRIGRRKKYVS
jgi:hypothetical protein